MIKVDNAIILAAGTASRFAPLSYEMPKGLVEVKGEVLIERQIRQLKEAGIDEIIIVVGYKKEKFEYLKEKFGVVLVENPYYLERNNNSSIYVARKWIKNTYICSSDNYFRENPFTKEVEESYYAAVYEQGNTNEWCITEDENGYIKNVVVGGRDSWVMLGHVFWSEKFSRKFISILSQIFDSPDSTQKLWESIYIENIGDLPMKIKKYDKSFIFEFDTLDGLREFDKSYVENTRSEIIKSIAKILKCEEKDLSKFVTVKDKNNEASGFEFEFRGMKYKYDYQKSEMEEI